MTRVQGSDKVTLKGRVGARSQRGHGEVTAKSHSERLVIFGRIQGVVGFSFGWSLHSRAPYGAGHDLYRTHTRAREALLVRSSMAFDGVWCFLDVDFGFGFGPWRVDVRASPEISYVGSR